jgi:hypothetical protein
MKYLELWLLGVLLAACASVAAHAADSRSYAADLAALYNEHQRVLALRAACITARPSLRSEVEAAFKVWRERHEDLIDDLEDRFAALVKRASKDRAEFSRNYGKYRAEVVALREDNKRTFLARDKENKEKFSARCREFPAYLRHSRSDIPEIFSAEFRNVYRAR